MRDMTIERHMDPRPPLPPRSEEYIDILGHLQVPVASWWDSAPKREGWIPYWVNINLSREPVKIYSYKREDDA